MNASVLVQTSNKDRDMKKSYQAPILNEIGDILTSTMAPSPGVFESGPGRGYRRNRNGPEELFPPEG